MRANYHDGELDSLGIWSRVLSSGEITELYNRGLGRAYSDLTDTHKTSLFSFYDFANYSDVGKDSHGVNHVSGNADLTLNGVPIDRNIQLTDGLVSWWNLDEKVGVRYDAHSTFHLNPQNAPGGAKGIIAGQINQVGVAGKAALFNGASQLVVAHNASQNFTGGITVATWVKLNTSSLAGLLSKCDQNGQRVFCLDVNGDTVRFAVSTDGSAWTSISQSGLLLDTWYFMVAGISGGLLTLQVNAGTANTAACGLPFGGTSSLILGRYTQSGSEYLNGCLDSVSLWNRALTSGEILYLYNEGRGRGYSNTTGTVLTGLISWYDFEDVANIGRDQMNINALSGSALFTPGIAEEIGVNEPVGTWENLAGNEDAAQDISDYRPTTYYDGTSWFVRLDGADDKMTVPLSLTPPYTIYSVVQASSGTILNENNRLSVLDNEFAVQGSTTLEQSGRSGRNIVGFVCDKQNSTLRVNGRFVEGNLIVSSPSGFTIGANHDGGNPLAGDLQGIYVYNKALNAREISRFERYLSSSFSIPLYSAFVPTELSGLEFWLDCTSPTYMVMDASGVTSQLTDRSSNSRNFVQGTPTQRATYTSNLINGKGGLLLDGVNDCYGSSSLNFLHNADSTLFLVTKPASNGSMSLLGNNAGQTTNTGLEIKQVATSQVAAQITAGVSGQYVSSNVTTANYMTHGHVHVLTVAHQPGGSGSARSRIVLDGTADTLNNISSLAPSSGNAYGDLFLGSNGGSSYFSGHVLHVLAYSRLLSEPERDAVERYLARELLEAPSNVTVFMGDTEALISWSAVDLATSYDVEMSISGTNVWEYAGSTSSTSLSITGLTYGQFYDFRVTSNYGN